MLTGTITTIFEAFGLAARITNGSRRTVPAPVPEVIRSAAM